MPTTRRLALTIFALIGLAFAATFTSARAQDMPPLPDPIKKQGLIRAGIKCDYPPDGFLDAQGKNQGAGHQPGHSSGDRGIVPAVHRALQVSFARGRQTRSPERGRTSAGARRPCARAAFRAPASR